MSVLDLFKHSSSSNGSYSAFMPKVLISLVYQIELMTEDIQPLLVEVRDSRLLKDAESLTKSLAEATEDLR